MELLGQRWALRVIWELEQGTLRFVELRRRMGNCSSSVLSERLRQLSAADLVVKNQAGTWELTVGGAQLGSALTVVWDWAEGGPGTSFTPDERHSASRRGHTSASAQARPPDQPGRLPPLI